MPDTEPVGQPSGRQGVTARNFVLGFGIRFGAVVLGAATAAVVARVLDPAGVAQSLVALSVGTTIGVVCQAGLPMAIAHRVARVRVGAAEVTTLRRDLRGAFFYLLGVMTLVMVAAILPWPLSPTRLIPDGTVMLLAAAVLIGGGRAASRVLSETNKGYGDVNTAGLGADLVGPTVGLAGVALLAFGLHEQVTSSGAVWMLALGWGVASAFAWWRAPVRPSLRLGSLNSEDQFQNVMGVLGVISLLNVGIQQAHIIMSGLMLPLTAAAVFATVARVAPLAGTPLMLLGAIASPDIGVVVQTKDPAGLARLEVRLQRVTGLLLLGGLLIMGVFVFLGEHLLSLLFGSAYAVGKLELVILALGPLASLAAGVAGMCLLQAGRHRRMLIDTVIGSTVAVTGMVMGAMYGESVGLAVGYTVGQVAINLLLLRSCHIELNIKPYARPIAGLRWLLSRWSGRL